MCFFFPQLPNRLALAGFKNRVLYANVSYDRILPIQIVSQTWIVLKKNHSMDLICSILSNNAHLPPNYFCFYSCSLFSWAYPRYGWLANIFIKERKGSYKGSSISIIDHCQLVALNEWHLNRSYCSTICSPHIVHWMVTSTLWMLNTVRLYHQKTPIFLPKLPELRKLHNERQTQKTLRNTTKWWRVSRNLVSMYVCWSCPLSSWMNRWHRFLETEEMIHGLQKVGWKKVDVNFHSSFWPYLAHNNIHVCAAQFSSECFRLRDILSPVHPNSLFV